MAKAVSDPARRQVKRRYIAKRRTWTKKWGVYDTALGSWPGRGAFGKVSQDLASEAEADAEADRLEGLRESQEDLEKRRAQQEVKGELT